MIEIHDPGHTPRRSSTKIAHLVQNRRRPADRPSSHVFSQQLLERATNDTTSGVWAEPL
jgi:hypothetical protein